MFPNPHRGRVAVYGVCTRHTYDQRGLIQRGLHEPASTPNPITVILQLRTNRVLVPGILKQQISIKHDTHHERSNGHANEFYPTVMAKQVRRTPDASVLGVFPRSDR